MGEMLPLFPLGAVLYPGMLLPLHIFEERYRQLVSDLLDGAETERTRLRMVRTRPVPFPPEPLAWLGIQLTRWSLAREDATGRRNAWLRLLDRVGLGFDS